MFTLASSFGAARLVAPVILPPTDGLKIWYKMDEGDVEAVEGSITTSSLWNRATNELHVGAIVFKSTSAVPATLTVPDTTEKKTGSASARSDTHLNSNHSSYLRHILSPANLTYTDAAGAAVSAWVFFPVVPPADSNLYLLFRLFTTDTQELMLYVDSGTPRRWAMRMQTSGGTRLYRSTVATNPQIVADTWVHAAMVLPANAPVAPRLFINGKEVPLPVSTSNILFINAANYKVQLFGYRAAGQWFGTRCSLDDFRMYERALTEEEVQTIYAFNA